MCVRTRFRYPGRSQFEQDERGMLRRSHARQYSQSFEDLSMPDACQFPEIIFISDDEEFLFPGKMRGDVIDPFRSADGRVEIVHHLILTEAEDADFII